MPHQKIKINNGDINVKLLWNRYREIIMYLIFGVLTTLVGMGSYFFMLKLAEVVIGISPDQPTFHAVRGGAQIIQWVLAVLFAYFTNKRWVFRAEGGNEPLRLASFFGARLFSLGVDTAVTFGVVLLLGAVGYVSISLPLTPLALTPDLLSKIAAAAVVIVTNYLLSKFIVFKNK